MPAKILVVAGPQWQNALTGAAPPGTEIEPQTAAAAVTALAASPTRYSILALAPDTAGHWLDTLLDLTLGDTEHTVPLLMLGATSLPGLHATPTLSWPVSQDSLTQALTLTAAPPPHNSAAPLPEAFSNFESIRIRYQPVIRLRDMLPTTLEVLARVITKQGRTMGPGTLITAMANNAHAMAITKFILQLALSERQRGGFDNINLKVAFNLPLDTLLDPKILPALEAIRITSKIPPNAIKLELTETQPVTNTDELAAVIDKFTAAGYRLALDDITPTTHNLAALLQLPFRAVKLDRSVITDAQNPNPATAAAAREFITTITAQAATLQRAVIAEGIETPESLKLMQSLGATHGQGYHFARPLPAGALQPWLAHWRHETGV